jgi:hypothetical protein
MVDIWISKSPGGKDVTFKIEGSKEAGFVYYAKMDGRDLSVITGSLEDLTREQVEALFDDYVAEK